MTNVHYLRKQLTMALDCIKRGLDALEAEPSEGLAPTVAAMFPADLPPKAVLDSLGLVEVNPQEKLWIALTERVDKLTQIVLAIDPETCAKHDLLPF